MFVFFVLLCLFKPTDQKVAKPIDKAANTHTDCHCRLFKQFTTDHIWNGSCI